MNQGIRTEAYKGHSLKNKLKFRHFKSRNIDLNFSRIFHESP